MTEKTSSILFTDLSLMTGREIDGMAAGTFTDMWGREVTIDNLEDYVKNTTDNLEATRTESGELVGLPIDAYGHDEGDGAGWITGVRKEGDVIRFAVKWTELGADLIQRGVRRFFSPTFLPNQHVILGGSLTNWPATRTKKGKILLRPIELSEQLMEVEFEDLNLLQRIYDSISQLVEGLKGAKPEEPKPTQLEEPMPELTDLTPEQIAELHSQFIAGLASNPPAELSAIIETEVTARIASRLAEEQRKTHVADFAARVTGGSDEQPIGLPVDQATLSMFLLGLTPEQQKTAEDILQAVFEKDPIIYTEVGHSKVLAGQIELPDWAKPMLSMWVDKGLSIADFFAANMTELGDMQDYNLTEFVKEK